MKTIEVKVGKPSKFYINNKRIGLNTAFGMYQKGAKFTVNGKKLNLNKFGMRLLEHQVTDKEILAYISDSRIYGAPHAKKCILRGRQGACTYDWQNMRAQCPATCTMRATGEGGRNDVEL